MEGWGRRAWNLSAYEAGWLIGFSTLAVAMALVREDGGAFEASVTISGLFCVLLAAKGDLRTYVFGMYNTLGYAWIAHANALYGEMGLNLFFFLPMNFAGLFLWKRHIRQSVVEMRGLKMMAVMAILGVCLISTVALGWSLSMIEGQNTPYIDAATNVLSVVATFLMVLRYREQWLVYILLNILTILMWSLRFMDGGPEARMMMLMWFAYLINSVYGCRVWYRGAALGREIA
jgi:nicotinamide mononucleotide transporter